MRTKSLYLIVTISFLFLAQLVGLAQETEFQHDTIPEGYRRIAGPGEAATDGTVPFEEVLLKAEAGDVDSQVAVGNLYFSVQDYNNAVKWHLNAANKGVAWSQFCIAVFYEEGMGVAQDLKEAAKWYLKAAEQGYSVAQSNIGTLYADGKGVPQDYKEALKWQTKAAKQGFDMAQYFLGWMYYKGQGVPKDYIEAYKWWNLAASQGYDEAAKKREFIKEIMTPQQIAEAQRLCREFRPKKQGQPAGNHAQAKAEIKGSGTGFFITADGYILTAYHVVKEADSIQIWTNKGLKPASIVRADTVNDIALLKVEGIQCEALPVQSSRGGKVGAEVFTLGFPNIQLQGTEAKYTNGHINSLSGFADDPRLFQISAAIQPGNSGGPLLRPDGTVVGIVVAKLDEIATANTTGSLPQNVNYALKSSFVLSFLEALPELSGKLLSPPEKKQGLVGGQIIEKTNRAVVMVLSY
jgi:S1-C subfamily serine protease